MKARQLHALGVPEGAPMKAALAAAGAARKAGLDTKTIRKTVTAILQDPSTGAEDPHFAAFAAACAAHTKEQARVQVSRKRYARWGGKIEPGAVEQMENACSLPVSAAGALMPDAHQGYGLPIGGVLATRNAVIPYAVGVDIACRMKLSVLDLPLGALDHGVDKLKKAIEAETRFGTGASFKPQPRQHAVMDEDWTVSPETKRLKDLAWSQLGTSGAGNHFVDFGVLTLEEADLGLEAGRYVAVLSHSGSRGTGLKVANHYSKLAMSKRPELPKHLTHLSWLDLGTHDGQEYWAAMELMGRYAAANHAIIHREIARHLGVDVLLDIENHHNFAWKERWNGEEVVVHRKGATPAGKDALGIIPGSMASPGFVVRGKGCAASLNSAAHGAGRRMSRSKAKARYTWDDLRQHLRARGVELISAGLDEIPMAYKDIEEVMSAQADLVTPVARFDPKLVKMAHGERRRR